MQTDYQEHLEAEAYTAGRRAGSQYLAPGLNPYEIGTALHEQWRLGYLSALAQAMGRQRAA